MEWTLNVVTVASGYQRFGGPCCLHLHSCENLKSRVKILLALVLERAV